MIKILKRFIQLRIDQEVAGKRVVEWTQKNYLKDDSTFQTHCPDLNELSAVNKAVDKYRVKIPGIVFILCDIFGVPSYIKRKAKEKSMILGKPLGMLHYADMVLGKSDPNFAAYADIRPSPQYDGLTKEERHKRLADNILKASELIKKSSYLGGIQTFIVTPGLIENVMKIENCDRQTAMLLIHDTFTGRNVKFNEVLVKYLERDEDIQDLS